MADRNLDHLYPPFAVKVKSILLGMRVYCIRHMPGYEWKVTDGFRTVSEQQRLYATVPKVTHRDGVRKKSTHQYGLAVDIAPFKNGKLHYGVAVDHWNYLAHLARAENLDSGNDWQTFRDRPHIEWKPQDHSTYRKAWRLVQERGLNV